MVRAYPLRMTETKKLDRPPDEGPLDIYEGAAREGIKVLLELFGFGTLASILDRAIPTSFLRRVELWNSNVHRAIRDLQRQVKDFDALKRDPEFREFVADVTAAAMRTHRDEKHKALSNVLVNAAVQPSNPAPASLAKARMFLRFLDELDVSNLLLLALMHDQHGFLAKRGKPMPGPASNPRIEMDVSTQHESPRSLRSIVNSVLRGDLPADLDNVVLQDLVRRGLVEAKTTFSDLCVGRSLASPLGQEFVRFIADAPNADPEDG